jgi:tetratricopeptide (TPR) repeat protein
MHLMSVACNELKQFDHAVEWASRAIRKDAKPAFLVTLAIALRNLGRHEDAVKVFDTAVQLKPDDAQLWFQLGSSLLEAGRSSDALLCFQHAVVLNPRHRDAAYGAGYVLAGLEQFEEALVHFNRSAEIESSHAPTLQMRAIVLRHLKRFDEAIADNLRAMDLDPTNPDICNNMGAILGALGRIEEALSWYDRSLAINPNIARNITNRASALYELGRFDEAMATYQRAISVDPNLAEAPWNLALVQMLVGNFKAGWSGREARWKIPAMASKYLDLHQPMWLGTESVAGKTVIVCQDEGLGDAIQFARYVPLLAARGAHVILIVDEPLRSMLSGLVGVSQCLPKSPDTQVPPYDFHVPISSLPLAFGTELDTIPAEPYFPRPMADRVQAWDDRLGPHEKLRVGIVWSGNPQHRNDHNRSISLRALSRILDLDAMFISLQKNPRPEDVESLHEKPDIVDFTTDLTDFAETAALVSCLDLVIAVDTSVAHLAAALGRPTWILLPYVPDYRWLLGRDDSPWYPTMRLLRQTETREYESVIERLRAELSAAIEDEVTKARQRKSDAGS